MAEPPTTLKAARDQTIDALCRQFAEDSISMSELDRRLARARSARTRAELNALLSDLPGANVPATAGTTAPSAPPADATAAARGDRPGSPPRSGGSLAFAVMGGTRRAGRWTPPSQMVALAIMGGVELDFREAALSAGVTEVNCFAFWGGIEVTVPPTVHVEVQGFALLGGFEQAAGSVTEAPPGAPVIRVNGLALMGGVEVNVREPGVDRKGRPERSKGRLRPSR